MSALTSKAVNRSNNTKKVDNFHVSFFNLLENESNILGRQVYSVQRPAVLFRDFNTNYKGADVANVAKLDFDNVDIIFDDDETSLAKRALLTQIYRQMNRDLHGNVLNNDIRKKDQNKFEINVKCFDARDRLVEEFTMKGCLIIGLNDSELIYSNSEGNKLTASVSYDTIDFNLE